MVIKNESGIPLLVASLHEMMEGRAQVESLDGEERCKRGEETKNRSDALRVCLGHSRVQCE